MEEMSLFIDTQQSQEKDRKEGLIHYRGELGDFWYDPKEFEVCYYYDNPSYNYLHYVGNSNSVSLPKGCINTQYMFWKCRLPEGFQLVDFDTSEVVDMHGMFRECEMSAGLSLGDKFDTSNVEDMAEMFANCTLPGGFVLNNKFDTAKVIDMRGMFAACKMSDNFTLGVNFNVSNVADTDNMFSDCALPEGRSLKDFNESTYSVVSWLKQRTYYLQGKEKVHYEGALGNFDYDPREFIITRAENYDECLHYHGNGNSVSLPKGCINIRHMFEGCNLPEGFELIDFDTSDVINMSICFMVVSYQLDFLLVTVLTLPE